MKREITIPKEKRIILNNLTKMINTKIGIDGYLLTEQDIADKYKIDVDVVISKEKEAILLEPESSPKLRRIKILNNFYYHGLNYYEENQNGSNSDFTDALIINKKGELLLLLRNKNSSLSPNKYCLPGGHLEHFLTKEQNVLKEIKEETNLDIINCKQIAIKNINNGKNKIFYFLCIPSLVQENIISEVVLNEKEHSNYKWVSLNELKNMKDEEFIFDLRKYLLYTLLGQKDK